MIKTKTIKLEEKVYDQLDRFRIKGETFSQAVEKLLSGRETASGLILVLEGAFRFREWQRDQLEASAAATEEAQE